MLKRLSTSSLLQILILLVAADLFLTVYVPSKNPEWYQRSISGSNEPFCRKIIEYICSNKEPEVLVLGSSLFAVPSLSCDQTLIKVKEPYQCLPSMFEFSSYRRSEFFKLALSTKLGRKVDVVNLGLAGLVASDYLSIMEKALQFHKSPALVVCTVAPAEFVWNDKDVSKTRVHQAFESYAWPGGTGFADFTVNKWRREIAWHYDSLQSELGAYRNIASDRLSEFLHLDSAAASEDPPVRETTAPVTAQDAWGRCNRLEDLEGIKDHYAKIDPVLFEKHIDNFDKMLNLCKEHHIPIVVVNMPITKNNKALLLKRDYDKYYGALSSAAHKYGVPFVDMDQPDTFSLSDYFDSAHLNEVGGRKFFMALADRLARVSRTELCAVRSGTYQ